MPDLPIWPFTGGSPSLLSGKVASNEKLVCLLRKLDAEDFVRNLIDEIETHGLTFEQRRFISNAAMHTADERKHPIELEPKP